MDIASLICAFLADRFASEKEQQAEHDRLQDEIDDLRDEIDDLKDEREENQ